MWEGGRETKGSWFNNWWQFSLKGMRFSNDLFLWPRWRPNLTWVTKCWLVTRAGVTRWQYLIITSERGQGLQRDFLQLEFLRFNKKCVSFWHLQPARQYFWHTTYHAELYHETCWGHMKNLNIVFGVSHLKQKERHLCLSNLSMRNYFQVRCKK